MDILPAVSGPSATNLGLIPRPKIGGRGGKERGRGEGERDRMGGD